MRWFEQIVSKHKARPNAISAPGDAKASYGAVIYHFSAPVLSGAFIFVLFLFNFYCEVNGMDAGGSNGTAGRKRFFHTLPASFPGN